jgi:hypothetical protein
MIIWNRVAVFAFALCATPAVAGGLFGDGGVLRGDIGSQIDKSVVGGTEPFLLTAPAIQTFDQAIQSTETAPVPGLGQTAPLSYEQLLANKTPEQLAYEKSVADLLKYDVSTICVTPSAACEVDLTITGSSCFCTHGKSIEIGLVQ